MTPADTLRTALAAIALALCQPALGQAGDQPFEDVDVIELPGATPARRGLRLNWDCEVLLIEDSRRFRPGHCPGDDEDTAVQELTLEQEDEHAEEPQVDRRRKLMY